MKILILMSVLSVTFSATLFAQDISQPKKVTLLYCEIPTPPGVLDSASTYFHVIKKTSADAKTTLSIEADYAGTWSYEDLGVEENVEHKSRYLRSRTQIEDRYIGKALELGIHLNASESNCSDSEPGKLGAGCPPSFTAQGAVTIKSKEKTEMHLVFCDVTNDYVKAVKASIDEVEEKEDILEDLRRLGELAKRIKEALTPR